MNQRYYLLIEERVPDADILRDFEEREGHSATDDHLVHFVQHVLDQLNLVCHFRSAQNRQEGTSGVVQGLEIKRIRQKHK